jgi:demethylmenaquinone methyltransferase / 2-methoxy-6-polyprenyl-1,4-benzoquinol methylase
MRGPGSVGSVSEAVRRMFADIAPAYDRANAVLSLGVHGRWRKVAVAESGAKPGMSVLDCATGTGDLAFQFAKRVAPDGEVVGPGRTGGSSGPRRAGLVIGTDFCPPMIEKARVKTPPRHAAPVSFQPADALALPFRDDRFDVASISFGIRNVDDPSACLVEMARVVRAGGRVVVLEFGQPRGLMAAPFKFYSKHVIPRVGALISGHKDAYEYLPETSAAFPSGEKFLQLMRDAKCFTDVTARPLTGGIAYCYTGTVA